ncbi:hypothetical protein E1264_11625 [Actinomadura sp. KC216]|uniref:hypothetical protein n=1 Tax=Actinomadura sp. KC216 TaxID=2530370 RepID=UPI00104739D5|nr:hypothetical protein [Actinomadura sp. KC216]TDB88328.1 hypothetical protein E1264_11625 [Actinomadura sp. KC216]
MTVLNDARPSGAAAVRLTGDEAAALVEATGLAASQLLTQVRELGLEPDGALGSEAHALAAAVRKLDALGDVAGLEIHARRTPIFERHGP